MSDLPKFMAFGFEDLVVYHLNQCLVGDIRALRCKRLVKRLKGKEVIKSCPYHFGQGILGIEARCVVLLWMDLDEELG